MPHILKKYIGGNQRKVLILGARPCEKSHFKNIQDTDIIIYLNDSPNFDEYANSIRTLTEEEENDNIRQSTSDKDIIKLEEITRENLNIYPFPKSFGIILYLYNSNAQLLFLRFKN
jgi:hypothetical protein